MCSKFKLHSSNYEWLVVTGARAQYKGTGTINGTGGYKFTLTAIDRQRPGGGGVDKFRIKIWRESDDVVIYDNQKMKWGQANLFAILLFREKVNKVCLTLNPEPGERHNSDCKR